ncbi:fatty acid-binding protein, adipocyte-like [Schistocerca cancellata]|uniref:fatty acid-binding protein, adipocyte-like n=1 Tax=Schistocerca cancellata TaxID=274614 RepID=UPI002119541C|nr:fatty acid-binding protein, adipocyte-like [Schistocerca cancellata]
MVKQFSGKKYELDVASQENMDAFLQAVGVDDADRRKEILGTKMTIGLAVNGDEYTFSLEGAGRKFDTKCKLDEEFDETMWDRTTRSKYSVKGGDTVVHWAKYPDGKVITSETKYSADKALQTVALGNVVAKKTFKAI